MNQPKYYLFVKCLNGALKLIETSSKEIESSKNTIALSDIELQSYKAELYFVCQERNGRFMKDAKKVKTGKAFLKFINN